MAKKINLTKNKVKAAFNEVHKNTPKVVKATMKKKGKKAANKQKVAIAINKARAKGANIPQAPTKNKPITRNDVMKSIGDKAKMYA